MGVSRVLVLAIGIVVGVIVFLASFGWLSGIIGFGDLGTVLALLLAGVVGYIAYLIIMKLYGAAKS